MLDSLLISASANIHVGSQVTANRFLEGKHVKAAAGLTLYLRSTMIAQYGLRIIPSAHFLRALYSPELISVYALEFHVSNLLPN